MTCECKACEVLQEPLRCEDCYDGHFQSAFSVPNLYTSLRYIPSDDIKTEAIDSLLEMLVEVANTLHDNISRDKVDFDWVAAPIFRSLRTMMAERNFVRDDNGFLEIAPNAPRLINRWLDYGGLKLAALKILADVSSPNVYHMKLQELLYHFSRYFYPGPDKSGLVIPVVAYGATRVTENKKFSPVGILARAIHSYADMTGGTEDGR